MLFLWCYLSFAVGQFSFICLSYYDDENNSEKSLWELGPMFGYCLAWPVFYPLAWSRSARTRRAEKKAERF